MLFPAILCVWILHDRYFSHEAKALCLVALALSLFAALRPNWRWLFWGVWSLNAVASCIVLYLVLFWHLFAG